MTLFLNQLINGLQIGSIYALIALGYTMVYGIVKLINFAHGDIIMEMTTASGKGSPRLVMDSKAAYAPTMMISP